MHESMLVRRIIFYHKAEMSWSYHTKSDYACGNLDATVEYLRKDDQYSAFIAGANIELNALMLQVLILQNGDGLNGGDQPVERQDLGFIAKTCNGPPAGCNWDSTCSSPSQPNVLNQNSG